MRQQLLYPILTLLLVSQLSIAAESANSAVISHRVREADTAQQPTSEPSATLINGVAKTIERSRATQSISALQNPQANASALKPANKPEPSLSQQQQGYWLYRANVRSYQDYDGDGYYQRLNVYLDIDTNVAGQWVYLQFALRDSWGHRQQLYQSSMFYLSGQTDSDWLEIDSELTGNWPTDRYQLEVTLVDGYQQALYVFAASNAPAFADLDLEDSSYDQNFGRGFILESAELQLTGDRNQNGYYSNLIIDARLYSPRYEHNLRADFYLSGYGRRQFIGSSSYFSTERGHERHEFTIQLGAGLTPGRYHLEMVLQQDQWLVGNWAEQQITQFANLPLESAVYDDPTEPPYTEIVHESGALPLVGIVGFIGLATFRRRRPHRNISVAAGQLPDNSN